MKQIIKSSIIALAFLTYSVNGNGQQVKQPVDYVNPYIGNISHLLVPTYPTVHLPNSMLRLVPARADFTSPYLNGLPVFLTSHRGEEAFSIKPFTGNEADIVSKVKYNYDLEKIKPYEYSVYLQDQDMDVKLAPAHQSAIYQFNYHSAGDKYYMVSTRNGELKVTGNTVSGYQRLDDSTTKAYVYMVFDKQPRKAGVFKNETTLFNENIAKGKNAALILAFNKADTSIGLRYGVSFISEEQAKKNLQKEIPDFNLNRVAANGRAIWNSALGKIQVKGGSENDRIVFYTSLYRTYERMVNISEDGRYFSPFDKQVHADNGISYFTDDWIWDTYRAAHPLQLLLNPGMQSEMINSYILAAEQSKEKWMPTFPTILGDGHAMNGNHAVAYIWDAYSKGIKGFDLERAYEYCKNTIMQATMAPWTRGPVSELDSFYKAKGYFPALKPGEKETVKMLSGWEKRQAVAVTLAASFDDWCLAQMAKALGKTGDAAYFTKRAYNYRNLFNAQTGFFHPKDKDGNFIEPFDYRFSGGIGVRDYYDENNGWTYRWDVQHNIGDLVSLMGGAEKFNQNLDRLFAEPLGKSKYEFYSVLPDQTGNVGQFTMGNEPSLNIPYLYNYAGAPWKTQKRVRLLLSMWFRNDLMGIPGDEDGGGLSAFAVFSSMGFYPVTAGSASYNIGSPLFSHVSIDMSGGKQFIIDAKNCSADNKYIQSARLNGRVWNKPWFTQKDIANGGRLELVMSNHPNKSWGANPADAPPSAGPYN